MTLLFVLDHVQRLQHPSIHPLGQAEHKEMERWNYFQDADYIRALSLPPASEERFAAASYCTKEFLKSSPARTGVMLTEIVSVWTQFEPFYIYL